MTVEADLFNLLKTLVSNRAFPDFAPVNTTRPYITYQQIGGEVVVFTEGAMADHDNGVFRFHFQYLQMTLWRILKMVLGFVD